MEALIYYVDKKTFKEPIKDNIGHIKCPFCGDWFIGLAYHTRQKHKVSSKDLRNMLGVKYNYRLCTDAVIERHKEIAINNKDICIKQNLLIAGKNTRFIKGSKGHIRKEWSKQALTEMSIRNKVVN